MKTRAIARVALILFLGSIIPIACQRSPRPSPTPKPLPVHRITPLLTIRLVGTPTPQPEPLPPSLGTKTPRALFPWMGQQGAPGVTSAPPSPSPPPPSPAPQTQLPPPSPHPLPSPTVPKQQVNIPMILGNPPPISEEPLNGSGQYLGLVVELSQAAGELLPADDITRVDAIRALLPQIVRAQVPQVNAVLLSLSGANTVCPATVPTPEPPQPVTAIPWQNWLTGLVPGGSIPLAEGLLRAADAFPPGVRRPILLFAAGGPTCGQDLCQIARVLERADADVSIHVLDLGASGASEAALRCVAQATGGTYYKVQTRADLDSSLRDALTHALGGQIRVEVVGANGRPFFPAVVVGRNGQLVRTFDAWTDADLAPGTYMITVGTAYPQVFTNIRVRSGERTRLHVALGELHVILQDPRGQPVSAEVGVSRADYGAFYTRVGERVEVPLPAGRYTVTVRMDTVTVPVRFARDLPVVVGQVTERTLTLPVGYLQVNLSRVGNPATGFVEVSPASQPDVISMAGWANGRIETTLLEGTYTVRVRRYANNRAFYQVDDIVIRGGETFVLDLSLDDGTIRVLPTASDGTPLHGTVKIFPAGEQSLIVEGPVDTPLTVPAGRYDVRVDMDGGERLWAWDVEVRPGEETEVRIERPQARLWAQAVDASGQPLAAWGTLYAGDRATLVEEARLPTRWIISPGDYLLWVSQYDLTGALTESEVFTLQAGDAYTLSVPLALSTLTIVPGDADSVVVSIFPAGDRETLLGEVKGGLPHLRLAPGQYDVRVVDARDGTRERWVQNITLGDGDTRVLHVRFGE